MIGYHKGEKTNFPQMEHLKAKMAASNSHSKHFLNAN